MKIGDEVYVIDTWRGEKYAIGSGVVTKMRHYPISDLRLAWVKYPCGGERMYVVGGGVYESREEAEKAMERYTRRSKK